MALDDYNKTLNNCNSYACFDIINNILINDNYSNDDDNYYDLSDEEAQEIFEDAEADKQITFDKEAENIM